MRIVEIPSVLAFRLLPFLGYVTVTRGAAWWKKILYWVFFVLVAWAAHSFNQDLTDVVIRGPIVLAYFTLVSLGVYHLAQHVGRARASRGMVFFLCAFAYTLLPALCHRSPGMVATIGLGWEAMLSAYSYAVDSRKADARPTFGACLFFILVNPTLVYAERGYRVSSVGFAAAGVGRVGLGIFAWTAQALLEAQLLRAATAVTYASFVVHSGGNLLALYFAHSGLASVQIGLSRMVGHQVPERYLYPLFSKSPDEFWRRWNVYVGSWVKRYAYFPLGLQMRRRWRRAPGPAVAALVVISCFGLVGMLHDYAISLQAFVLHLPLPGIRVTSVFLSYGGLLVAWWVVARALSVTTNRASADIWLGRMSNELIQRLVFLHALLAMMWLMS